MGLGEAGLGKRLRAFDLKDDLGRTAEKEKVRGERIIGWQMEGGTEGLHEGNEKS